MKTNIIKVTMPIFLITSVIAIFSIPKVEAGEPAIIGTLNDLGFAHIEETTQTTFPSGTYSITLYAEFAGYHQENELSIYKSGTSDFIVLFEGSEGNLGYLDPIITKTFTSDYDFGLSLLSAEARYFTEYDRNPDYPINHSIVFRNLDNPNMFLIGFEDLLGGGDEDYQDMVISLKRKPQIGIPEFGVETLLISSFAIMIYLALKMKRTRMNIKKRMKFWMAEVRILCLPHLLSPAM